MEIFIFSAKSQYSLLLNLFVCIKPVACILGTLNTCMLVYNTMLRGDYTTVVQPDRITCCKTVGAQTVSTRNETCRRLLYATYRVQHFQVPCMDNDTYLMDASFVYMHTALYQIVKTD